MFRKLSSGLCIVMLSCVCSMGVNAQVVGRATGFATLNGGTTGGAGGRVVNASTGTQIHQALCGRGSNDTPIIIQVSGTITPGNTRKVSGSCDTADGVIEIKKVKNISIVGDGALFDQIGIHIRESSNIILQNLHVRNVKKSGSPTSNGGDAIGMEKNVSNVWVDHCTLEASGGESDGYDALFDLKNNTKYVTLSYTVLKGSDRGGLVGSGSSDSDNNYITFHHNYYFNLKSRTPLLRFATSAHTYNNYWNGLRASGINSRRGARILVENNYFENARNPLGSFYDDVSGFWQVSGNIFGSNVTWEKGDDEFPAGPNPTSNTTVNIPYSYSVDDTSCIPNLVPSLAGADTGIRFSDGSCQGTTSSSSTNQNNQVVPINSCGASDGSYSGAGMTTISGNIILLFLPVLYRLLARVARRRKKS